MGAWEHGPWDNDSAADWYGRLFEEIQLAAKVEETLNADPEEYADKIRAAAALLIMLGRTYVWPPAQELGRFVVLIRWARYTLAKSQQNHAMNRSSLHEQ